MSITIYTYSDPYNLAGEPYWEEIKTCPYFCASQTLVNGMKAIYNGDFLQGRVTTVQYLLDAMYKDWESTKTKVRQHAILDQIMTNGVDQTLEPQMQQNLLRAFIFNRDEVFNSIRVFFELNVNPNDILKEKLTPEQKLIVKVYQLILSSGSLRDFSIGDDLTEDAMDEVIDSAMKRAKEGCNVDAIKKDHLVIHGIHQFTPIMLRAIEQLSQYKKVILLFNYQTQYSSMPAITARKEQELARNVITLIQMLARHVRIVRRWWSLAESFLKS